MSKNILGFDIGSGELKIVQWNGARIVRAIREPIPDNLVKGDRIVSYPAMSDLLKEITKRERLSGRDCAVILPAGQTYLRRLTMPAMTVDQLTVNLPYEFRDFLTMSKDKYFYDYAVNEIVSDEEGKPVQMDLTAAAVPVELIDDYRDMFRRAGFRLKTAVPVECAYANLLQGREGEFAILDLGHSMTRIHIYTGARFEVTRQIDRGLADLDAAIADERGVDEHVARTYKQSNHEGAQDLPRAHDVYSAIAVDIRKAVNFYGFNNRQSDLKAAWCAGGGVYIPALRDTIAQTTDLEMHTVDELMPPAAEDAAGNLPFFAAAVGAAMQKGGGDMALTNKKAVYPSKTTLNLAMRRKSEFHPKRLIPLLLLLFLGAALFGKFAVADRLQHVNEAQANLTALQSQKADLLAATAGYDAVAEQYRLYSVGWMTGEEAALVDRVGMLDLIESELMGKGRVLGLTGSGNLLSVQLSGITLDDTSGIVERLYQRDDVVNVSVYTATTAEETGTNATVSLIVTMTAEGGGQE